ncbi:regulatory-associated protein of mTOR [Culicoides brevitarsis]|uniref:regulatory-associated protein of mTOR n=1 Tax=Culicoides brevitarsis TaxID=469753 RepID=UPI00307B6107
MIEEQETNDDEQLPLSFCQRRHLTFSGAGDLNFINKNWRMKERMKTVSVALVVCLNVGVDPPDVVKIQPCARLEAWIDPSTLSPAKAIELIGKNLQAQYERWQPKARYKQSLDPTVEVVKKLCTSLRRNAKEERVLFHYNGHGVPRPTTNGEIWVFNEKYTQYIPLSIYDLQTWMGAPSIYVYDCSNAGTIVNSFNMFAEQHEREMDQLPPGSNPGSRNSPAGSLSGSSYKNCIQLAACGANQILPMNPNLPADLFTSCLTTPIKIALKWYTLQKNSSLVPNVSYDYIEKIPGQLNDRRTMLGELNWIFTAITDTIAWNILPRDLFQKLFRQDLLVASLFRNFLLAERILRHYDCTPISNPALPESYRHPMWDSWDLALDQTLSQLPDIIEKQVPFKNSPFFEEQLRAFEVWLEGSSEKRTPPEQLPIVLQVLLSQVHRTRALELLGRFLDLGPWAVNLALSVGIFPYVLKLLQSSAVELRPFLVFIWVKILAVDCTCQIDLVKDGYHKYFLTALLDQQVNRCIFSEDYHTYAAFVLASIVHNFPIGQENALNGTLLSNCLLQLTANPNPKLRQWLIICLGNLWQNFERARWSGNRDNAIEKLNPFLVDPVPEVRAAAVYAMGTFISSVTVRTEQANTMDRPIASYLLSKVVSDASPIVRIELLATLQWIVIFFENQFMQIFLQEPSGSAAALHPLNTHSLERMRRVSSNSSMSNQSTLIKFDSINMNVWHSLMNLCRDPYPEVAKLAHQIVTHVSSQAIALYTAKEGTPESHLLSVSLPPSPNTRTSFLSESPPIHHNNHMPHSRRISTNDEPDASLLVQSTHNRFQLNQLNTSASGIELRARLSDSHSANNSLTDGGHFDELHRNIKPIITTNYLKWSVGYFVRQSKKRPDIPGNDASPTAFSGDILNEESIKYIDRLDRLKRNARIRQEGLKEQKKVIFNRLENQIYTGRTQCTPITLKLHPYESIIAVAYKDRVALHDWTNSTTHTLIPAKLPQAPITGSKHFAPFMNQQQTSIYVNSLNFVNEHDEFLVMVGYVNGVVRIWNRNVDKEEPQLVTAWQAIGEPSAKKNINLVTAWHQRSQTIFAAGDSKYVKLWNAEQELLLSDIPTGTESQVVDIVCARNGIFAVGCGDGSIRLFDQRLPINNCRIGTYCEYNQSVLAVCLRRDCENMVAASKNGNVRLFDTRSKKSIMSWDTVPDVTSVAIHESADVIACGAQSSITIYGMDSRQLNQIKSQGFMGPRVSPVNCLSFHKHKVSLASGFVDNTVAVFSV